MRAPLQVLVVEDEPAQREVLTYNLESEGFAVRTAENGEEALVAVAERKPDLILLDWMMPNLSGLEVCRQVKSNAETADIAVIMLTARSEEADTVRGLDTGADDYVTKPYQLRELMARVRNQARRLRPEGGAGELHHSDIRLNPNDHRVMRGDREIKLGPKEFRLLLTLMEKPGRVLSRDQLLDLVWGHDIYVDERTVDVHVARLRKALKDGGNADPIRTVRGAGYALG